MRQASRQLGDDLPRTSIGQQAAGITISTAPSAASLILPAGTALQIGAGLAGTTAISAAARWLAGRLAAGASSVAIRDCTETRGKPNWYTVEQVEFASLKSVSLLNNQRFRSELDCLTPIEDEQRFYAALESA